jgi:hypothetical protein
MSLVNCEDQLRTDYDRGVQSDWRQEDAIVIWSASFYVEIHIQEMISEDWESQYVCNDGLESV